MERNALGKIVELFWRDLPRHYPDLRLDAFVVMPNHIHGVIEIVGAIHESPRQKIRTATPSGAIRELPVRIQRRGMSLPKIVGRFKMTSAKRINEIRGMPGAPVWHRNYYEHIVRDQRELEIIREYIHTNPARWDTDVENA